MTDSIKTAAGISFDPKGTSANRVVAELGPENGDGALDAADLPKLDRALQTDCLDVRRRDPLAAAPTIATLSPLDAPRSDANAAQRTPCSPLTTTPTPCTRQFIIGDTTVNANIHEWKSGPVLFFNVHDNENTSVEAALAHIREHGGRLVELQHTGERDIKFTLGGRSYAVDPNRIFSPAGIRRTLEDHGAYSPEAEAAVTAFSGALIREFRLDRPQIVVAMHNNTDGEPLQMSSYLPGGTYAHETPAAFVNPEQDPDDFFLVTTRALFERLRAANQNVVLQDSVNATDDGRLAVYRGRRNLPYVNIEAQHGHLTEQERMLETLAPVLRTP